MNVLYLLIPITFCLGLVGLGAFIWNLRNGQYEDLSGAAERILIDPPGGIRRQPSGAPDSDAPPPRASEEQATWSLT